MPFDADLPHDTDYPYAIRILAVFKVNTAVLHFDTEFNKMCGEIINHIMSLYASQNHTA